jgi:hypothetical protein
LLSRLLRRKTDRHPLSLRTKSFCLIMLASRGAALNGHS